MRPQQAEARRSHGSAARIFVSRLHHQSSQSQRTTTRIDAPASDSTPTADPDTLNDDDSISRGRQAHSTTWVSVRRERSDELSSSKEDKRLGFWETRQKRCSRITVHMRNPMGRRRRGARGDSSMFSRGGGGLVSFDCFLFLSLLLLLCSWEWWWWCRWCRCLLGFRLHLGRSEERRDELSRGEMMASAHTPHGQVFGGASIPSFFRFRPVFESGVCRCVSIPFLPLARSRAYVCRAADLTCKLLLERRRPTRRLAIAPPLPTRPTCPSHRLPDPVFLHRPTSRNLASDLI